MKTRKFKVLHSSELDKSLWNLAIKEMKGDVYETTEYLDAVCLNDWKGMVWGEYENVLPFCQKKKWKLVPYISMPPFCQKFGMTGLSKEEQIAVFAYFKKNNYLVDYRWAGVDSTGSKLNLILDKSQSSLDSIRSRYAQNLKRNIDKARKHLSIVVGESQEMALEFLLGLEPFQSLVWKKFGKQYQTLLRDIPCKIVSARFENSIVGVLIGICYGGKIYLIFPYVSDIGRTYQAMSLLIDTIVGLEEFQVIDFEGSSINAIANFYRQFGGEEVFYNELSWRRF